MDDPTGQPFFSPPQGRGRLTAPMPMKHVTVTACLLILLVGESSGFQIGSPMTARQGNTPKKTNAQLWVMKTHGSSHPGGRQGSSSRLYYRNETATQDSLVDAAVAPYNNKNQNQGAEFVEEEGTKKRTIPSTFHNHDDSDIEGFINNNMEKKSSSTKSLSFQTVRREVDRQNLHPLYKLVQEETFPRLAQFQLVVVASLLAAGTVVSPVLAAALPLLFVVTRKMRWQKLVVSSKAEHKAMFDATTAAYRQEQRQLVDQLLEAVEKEEQRLPSCVAVTMATGQEGQGVVRALREQAALQNREKDGVASSSSADVTTILALVRDPTSASAQALAKLSSETDKVRVELVQCDSTDAASLRQALQPAQAVYLCTTLNRANAGKWSMQYDSGQYQVSQGQAFVDAFQGLPKLQHVVYGTAPLRKWPSSFLVEPPIHYAAKWRVEQLLTEAKVPVTFLRKCPYHENFTKLTKAKTTQKWGVEGGGAFDAQRKVELQPGHYNIKAFTPDVFVYNMMDPRDAGQWAVLAFHNPSILVGKSLSVASDALTGPQMAQAATDCGALGDKVTFSYSMQPRWLFEALAFVEPTFVYISGLQRWSSDGGQYDLDEDGVQHVRKLLKGNDFTWCDHLEREGLGQFTETMADLLPDYTKAL